MPSKLVQKIWTFIAFETQIQQNEELYKTGAGGSRQRRRDEKGRNPPCLTRDGGLYVWWVGPHTCCAAETPSPDGLVSEQAEPEPIVISHQGPIWQGWTAALLSTGQLPHTHNTGIKTPICWPWLAARWAEDPLQSWGHTASPFSQWLRSHHAEGSHPETFQILLNCVTCEIWRASRFGKQWAAFKRFLLVSDGTEMMTPINLPMNKCNKKKTAISSFQIKMLDTFQLPLKTINLA